MKGLAIASFILGIIGFLFSFAFGMGLISSILAVILGIVPLIGKGKTGKPMAIAGIILGTMGGLISYGWIEVGKEFVKHPEKTVEEVKKKALETPAKKPVQREEIHVAKPKVTIKNYDLDIANVQLEEIYIEKFALTLINKGNAGADIDKIVFSLGNDKIERSFYKPLTLNSNQETNVSLISYTREFKKDIGIDSITANISVIDRRGKSLLEKIIAIPISKIKMGDIIELKYGNNLSITLISWKESKVAVEGPYRESEYYTFIAKPNMKFVVLLYEVKNNWIREQGIPHLDVGEITTSKGYIYKSWGPPLGLGSKEYNPRQATEREISDLKGYSGKYKRILLPEESIKDCIVFEIPQGQKPVEASIAHLSSLVRF